MRRFSRKPAEKELEARVRDLQADVEQLRSELAERPAAPAEEPSELSDEERGAVIEKAREELPALDKQVDESLEQLRRLATR